MRRCEPAQCTVRNAASGLTRTLDRIWEETFPNHLWQTQQLFLSWNWADDKNWNTVRRMNLLIFVHGCRILSIRMCRLFFDCSSKRFCTFVLVYISFLNPFLLPCVGVCDVIGGCDLFLSLLALPGPGPHVQHPGPSSAHRGDAGRRLRRRRHGGDFWTGGGGDGSYR